ncbi:hypothetical protein THASP1DRAFT_30790 [Thamnocephalis sphaerospora]|uniref:Uncharacterized protein n=1 Tax=Thamnocephalis sphaerospora TaxID=78915 RepID=A0A4P9XN78_9FUNG|nr:hypothetical protein THASP1DRAFT_30790 [Thamnocephalis sphaerospora]|eukprot:RKP07393.1 hypothetical protein THASP1DRAFT_30790 [Thamnocephalis sphaerospora]
MANVFAGGAECSGGNAMSGLMKQYSRDRSLQQDHTTRGSQRDRGAGSSLFRRGRQAARPGIEANMADEFLRKTASDTRSAAGGAFEFGALGKELDAIPDLGGPPPEALARHPAHAEWAADFAHEERQHALVPGGASAMAHPEWQEFDQAFTAAAGRTEARSMSGWESEFAQFDAQHSLGQASSGAAVDPAMHEQFEKAFEQAGTAWETEFAEQHGDAWASEFTKEQDATTDNMDSRAALAATAGQVVDIVNESDNPKFKQSSFLQFMRKLRDQEVVVEGNKVVEQRPPVGEAASWTAEFAQEQRPGGWASEFAGESSAQAEQRGGWASEFSGTQNDATQGSWSAQFEQQQQQQQQQQTGGPQEHALGDQWAAEFAQQQEHVDAEAPGTLSSEQERLREWTETYRQNIAHLAQEPEDQQWQELAKAWELQAARGDDGLGYEASINAEYDHYPFQMDNPYMRDPAALSAARLPTQYRSLQERIMEHEAVVQLDPTNAEAWHQLGQLQQENERDAAAIAAFRNALSHINDAEAAGDARISLAVAYANENCRSDAYAELERWITEHPVYGRAAGKAPAIPGSDAAFANDRHARVEQAMLRAVQARPDVLDARLQTSLGVLFNLSGEPEKAVDCFRAAVQARPADHMLWNRLGASLANSGHFPEALDAYRHALELRPEYVRVRYNVGITCVNLGQHREAAEHLLTALALQLPNVNGPMNAHSSMPPAVHSTATTDSLWTALRMTMNLLERPDLAARCDERNIGAFQGEFDF